MLKTLALCFLLLFPLASAALDQVSYSSYGRAGLDYDNYYVQLLKLALESSQDEYGPYQLSAVDMGMTQQHMVTMIKHRKVINIFWSMTSIEREQELQAIRIPLLSGLGGCRIFLIKQGEQEKFNAIHDIKDLKNFMAGQGHDWPDTDILRRNGFNVTTAKEHASLFSMLAKGRFQYFPRAIHEAFNEVNTFDGLAVEKGVLLQYDAPFFYFVSKENKRLASRIEYGLKKMIADGRFAKFFNENPFSRQTLEKAKLSERRIYRIENPLLSTETKQALIDLNYQSHCSLAK